MDFLYDIWNFLSVTFSQINIFNIFDIIVVAFIIFKVIQVLRKTSAEQLVKGLVIILLMYGVVNLLGMKMMISLMELLFSYAVFVVVVLFQPELRRIIGKLGSTTKGKLFNWNFSGSEDDIIKYQRKAINAVVDAMMALKGMKMGALVVFERDTNLGDIIDTGTIINAEPSQQIITNVFFNKAPLHDGAMIIRKGIVYSAGCILPLTKNSSVDPELGTRHRAAIGMTEDSDAVVVIVSEENGVVSIAQNGRLTRNYTRETLKNTLEDLIIPEKEQKQEKRFIKRPFSGKEKKNGQ